MTGAIKGKCIIILYVAINIQFYANSMKLYTKW